MPNQRRTQPQPDTDLPAELASPACRALTQVGYSRLHQLSTAGEADRGKLRGLGPYRIAILRDALAARGLSFAASENVPDSR